MVGATGNNTVRQAELRTDRRVPVFCHDGEIMFRDVVGLHGSLIIPFELVCVGIGIGYPILEVLKSLGVAPKEVDSANRAVTIALVVAAVCGERTIVLK